MQSETTVRSDSTVGEADVDFQLMMQEYEEEDLVIMLVTKGKCFLSSHKVITTISDRRCRKMSLSCPTEVHSLPSSTATERHRCPCTVSSVHRLVQCLSMSSLTIFISLATSHKQTQFLPTTKYLAHPLQKTTVVLMGPFKSGVLTGGTHSYTHKKRHFSWSINQPN